MNKFNKIILAGLAVFYSSAPVLACTFNFHNDTDSMVVLIDAHEEEHKIYPQKEKMVFGAVADVVIDIFELEKKSDLVANWYALTEDACAEGEEIGTIRFSDIKATATENDVPTNFAIEGSAQEFTVEKRTFSPEDLPLISVAELP